MATTGPELDEGAVPDAPNDGRFRVHLDVFEGPFDLLLGLISKHKLDVTEVSLSSVTDEFIGHIKAHEGEWPLEQATEFLVVAATLLDLKAARLLPSGDVEDEDDLALLEARDLLFARLLQYRAYKQISAWFAECMRAEARRFPRAVGMDPQFAGLLPEVLLGLGPDEFAAVADRALAPKPAQVLSVAHIHAPRVSVREQAAVLVDRLRRQREATFRALVGDCTDTLTVVARFLALLELFREGAVTFEQAAPLQDLMIRWTGGDDDVEVSDEFDVDAAEAAAREAEAAASDAQSSDPDVDAEASPEHPHKHAPESNEQEQPS
jgi:segregation and condensation protein A